MRLYRSRLAPIGVKRAIVSGPAPSIYSEDTPRIRQSPITTMRGRGPSLTWPRRSRLTQANMSNQQRTRKSLSNLSHQTHRN